METIYFYLGCVGFLFVIVSWAYYARTVANETVQERLVGVLITLGLGSALAIASLFTLSFNQPLVAILSIILSLIAIAGTVYLYWLINTSQTPLGDLQVKVGDKLLPFEALTADGERFSSDELLGQRTLLKFFRGGW